MNRKIATFALVSLLSSVSFCALAAETTKQGSALPPAAIPGINQGGHVAESNAEKANKKGEEAAGSNSGADSQSMEKESSTTSTSKEKGKKPVPGNSGG